MSNRENDGPGKLPDRDTVGQRRPPMVRRFKPGESGNPKGRPNGTKNCKTIVRAVAKETHAIVENGRRRRRSTLELVLLCLRNMALEDKNVRAFEELHRLVKTYQPQEADQRCGYLVVPAPMSEEDWIARQIELNKTRERPPIYTPELEPGRSDKPRQPE